MTFLQNVRRSSIFNEFSPEEQLKYFGIDEQKTLHHIDTLYYAVYLNEPEDIIALQENKKVPEGIQKLVADLRDAKTHLNSGFDAVFDWGMDLEGKATSFSHCGYCVSKAECFDIFIADHLPNKDTPRVMVQIRSAFLVEMGVRDALEISFDYVKEFFSPYGLFPVKVRENRIDYAFHTNLIQNPYKFFRDENLKRHLKASMSKYQKIGEADRDITIETFSLGSRRSNNVFYRSYNKACEVVTMHYKPFFILRWKQNGLISEFDKYVYEVAYELNSYRTGVLVGRLRWYLEHGHNEQLLDECRELLVKNHIRSDNCAQIEKKIRGVIPEPTMIYNVEFQTKRKFYTSCKEYLALSYVLNIPKNVAEAPDRDPLLRPIHTILDCGKQIVEYLTRFGGCVAFVEDRNVTMKKFLESGEKYQYWWKRIRGTPIDYARADGAELYREYSIAASMKRSRRMTISQIAKLAMLSRANVEDSTLEDDWTDIQSVLNDNDVVPILNKAKKADGVPQKVAPLDYQDIRIKVSRRVKPLIEKNAVREYENLSEEFEE